MLLIHKWMNIELKINAKINFFTAHILELTEKYKKKFFKTNPEWF